MWFNKHAAKIKLRTEITGYHNAFNSSFVVGVANVRKFAFLRDLYRHIAGKRHLTCQSFTLHEAAVTHVSMFCGSQRSRIFRAMNDDYLTCRALSLSTAGMHPINEMILQMK
jgi:hypothetical protein